MFILSRTGRTYARLSFPAGPSGSVLLPAALDWGAWPGLVLEQPDAWGDLLRDWAAEFGANVRPQRTSRRARPAAGTAQAGGRGEGNGEGNCGGGGGGDDYPRLAPDPWGEWDGWWAPAEDGVAGSTGIDPFDPFDAADPFGAVGAGGPGEGVA